MEKSSKFTLQNIRDEIGPLPISKPNDLKAIASQEDSAIISAFEGTCQIQSCDQDDEVEDLAVELEASKARRRNSRNQSEIIRPLKENGNDKETIKSYDITSTPFDGPNVINVPKGLNDVLDKISSSLVLAKEKSEFFLSRVQEETKDLPVPSMKEIIEKFKDKISSDNSNSSESEQSTETKNIVKERYTIEKLFYPGSPELFRKSIIPMSNTQKSHPYSVPSLSGGILAAHSTAKNVGMKQQNNILATSPQTVQDIRPKNAFHNRETRAMTPVNALSRPASRSPQRPLDRSPTTLNNASPKLPWSKKRPDLF